MLEQKVLRIFQGASILSVNNKWVSLHCAPADIPTECDTVLIKWDFFLEDKF